MAKLKTKSINGYGLSGSRSPGAKDGNTRGMPQPGVGDYYGSGVRNKTGKNRSSTLGNPISPMKLKKPPKSLA